MGIQNYEKSRRVVEHAIANHDFFKSRLAKQLGNPDYSLSSLEYSLKNLLHLMSNSHSDMKLLNGVLHRLIQQRTNYEGDKYRFDTIIMRMFYFLDMPNEALKVSLKKIQIFTLCMLSLNIAELFHLNSFSKMKNLENYLLK